MLIIAFTGLIIGLVIGFVVGWGLSLTARQPARYDVDSAGDRASGLLPSPPRSAQA
jgi:ABC-type antimicrobial peptide transport system permease subunit